MKKIFFGVFFVILMAKVAFADVVVTNFDENVKFTDFGREVSVKIKVRIEADRNTYYSEWRYIFDKRLKVEVFDARVVGREYKTSFGNNELRFEFGKAFDGDAMEFEFKYTQFNDDDINYSRQEYVSLPPFAEGAEGVLVVEVPDSLAVYSLNPKFEQNANVYSWKGKVPEGGIYDFFALTLKKATWKVEVLSEVKGKENFSKFDMKIPLYFKNGNNIVEDYNILANYNPEYVKIIETEDSIEANFDGINGSITQLMVKSTVKNDFDNRVWIKLNPNKYLNIDEKLARDLNNTVYQIQLNSKKQQPLYITLAEWVHDYIEYDSSYVGKEMDSIKILSEGKGVCAHYAKLYNDLLRTSGIPSVVVSGVSYDTEKKKFEDHAWNLVYVNGEWISIDPTWGLYSGKLPVSHIFFYFGERNVIDYIVYGVSINDFSAEVKKNVEFVRN